jgi:hypothetical protein
MGNADRSRSLLTTQPGYVHAACVNICRQNLKAVKPYARNFV